MAFEYAIALSGGIATGKSSATTILMLYGFRFIDADKIAHKLLDLRYRDIANMFGDEYIIDDKVNRRELGKLIFANQSKREELEEFLHPLIYNEIEAQATIQDKFKKPYIIDIPLFFEKNRYPIKNSIVVYASREQQIDRVISRDGFSKSEAIERIDAQMDIEEKKSKATFIIDNSKNLKHLQDECERVKQLILEI
ncbi:Dephospho-CoA kinase [hydrothermal vent metagenome]|uniref:Dephospho-CoA kinase n=1 Tax=hydrothermal vent metagenome TaxID=652676 RepID=A0A1W1EI46_9ZZZZ